MPDWVRQEVFYQLFYSLYALQERASALMRGHVRGQAIGRVWNRELTNFNVEFYSHIRPMIWTKLSQRPVPLSGHALWKMWENLLPELLSAIEWWEFYDLCQKAEEFLKTIELTSEANKFMEIANSLFARAFLPWAFGDSGRIERVHPPSITQKLQEAHVLLSNPKFAGPEQQFIKANQHLNERPLPDSENCVKDAVGALEGVARIISGQDKATLSDLIKSHFRGQMHPTLLDPMAKVYAYRGDVEGVGHGQTRPSDLTVDDARLVLGLCADYMVYLVSKFGDQSE